MLFRSGAESSLDNALSEARLFGLAAPRAKEIVKEICAIVSGWRAHFSGCGVRAADLDELAQYLDGDRLRRQREAFGR